MANGEQGTMIGAGVGTIFGPVGTLVGGFAGGAVSKFLDANKKDKKKPAPPPPPFYVKHKVPLAIGAAAVVVIVPLLFIALRRK